MLAVLLLAILAALLMPGPVLVEKIKAKGLRRSGWVQSGVVQAQGVASVSVPKVAGAFTPQMRLGYTVGDQWEPAIAADRLGNVYMLYPQYLGVPGCTTCPSPTMILQVSNDRGQTWSAPRQIATPGTGQWDAQIVVDPVDGHTVFASWLQNNKSDIAVAKSTDLGVTWSVVTADSTNAGTDKPILAVRGQQVAVVFNHAQKIWSSVSTNGGSTFTQTQINPNGKLGWSLAGGGTILPNGTIVYGWAGYEQSGGAKGKVNLFVSRSTDGGATWTNSVLDVSQAPPDCAAYSCGWAYLGAQLVLASDTSGNVYALWNSGSTAKGPNRVYFAKYTNSGATWSAKQEVSTAPAGKHHNFPAIAATGSGDVRISWMDTRAGGLDRWNTYYRRSTNGGTSWSAEVGLSTSVSGYTYIFSDGFRFPFGDYYEMDIDDQGTTHLIWGEGFSYDTPGSIWYARGQ
jgi:hypothetical protein